MKNNFSRSFAKLRMPKDGWVKGLARLRTGGGAF